MCKVFLMCLHIKNTLHRHVQLCERLMCNTLIPKNYNNDTLKYAYPLSRVDYSTVVNQLMVKLLSKLLQSTTSSKVFLTSS